jgi:putative addiction module killer protein
MYPAGYNQKMREMKNTIVEYVDTQGKSYYAHWLNGLKDAKGKAAIISRVDRMELGIFGDHHDVGNGVYELRIHVGPGYRVYYARDGKTVYLLLCGGDKSSQDGDIKTAKKLWKAHQRGK